MFVVVLQQRSSKRPLEKKGIVVAFTGRATHNADGIIVHSSLHFPITLSRIQPLKSLIQWTC